MMAKMRFAISVLLAAACIVGTAHAAPGDPIGPEFLIATDGSPWEQPEVVRDAAGNFLVVWQAEQAIHARRYFADGTPQGPRFTVSPPDALLPSNPAVAMNASGGYVVAWEDFDLDADGIFIYAQSFTADGLPHSGVLEVAELTQGAGYHNVTMNADGDFVVAWTDIWRLIVPDPFNPNEGSISVGYSTVRAKRYAFDGSESSGNILVNLSITNPLPISGSFNAVRPAVAMNAQGAFVVAWEDRSLLLNTVIQAQRFNSNGLRAGLKSRVDDPGHIQGAIAPAVAMDDAGNYLIAWQVHHSTGPNSTSGHEVWARRYTRSRLFGMTRSDPFPVSSSGISIHSQISLAMTPDGRATVAWGGSPSNICCVPQEVDIQRYAADGTPQGGQTMVSQPDARISAAPSVAMDSFGNPVVVWREPDGLKGRLYEAY